MKMIDVLSTGRYYSDERNTVCHAMKRGAHWALLIASAQMASLVDKDTVLIPVPSHTGYATETLSLAELIANKSGCKVKDIIRGRCRRSLYELKLYGSTLSEHELGFYLTEEVPEGKVILLDNVLNTGLTAFAAADVTGIHHLLVYAHSINNSNTF